MARVKGSKNKPKTIPSYESMLDEEDLLNTPAVKEEPVLVVPEKIKKEKKLIGHHPITGAEVWR
jgi:hypothetical protein